MKTVELPNGKVVIQNRLPQEAYMRLRTMGKEINRKKDYKRQNEKRLIAEQLEEMEADE
jgi:hypothetical protein